ncbi:hypothetical protein HYY69_01490 [Candidatus Woesearchaeota archaeon]|nr:hypothetical protein [Candidatus Woesearchaeota archaeon]
MFKPQQQSRLNRLQQPLFSSQQTVQKKSSFLAYVIFFAVIAAVLYGGYYFKNKNNVNLAGKAYLAEDGSEIITMYNICKEVGCFDPNIREKHPICQTRTCLQYD